MAHSSKQELRRAVLTRRDELSPETRRTKSETISNMLLSRLGTCITHKPVVAVYAAMNSEVDLDAFIRGAYRLGCPVAFPCMVHNPNYHPAHLSQPKFLMEFHLVSAAQYESGSVSFLTKPLTTYQLGAPELGPYPACPFGKIEFVAVPLVAFDDAGNRLGYGGGNYDRFLPFLPENARVFGVAFTVQKENAVPTERHDIPLKILSA